MPRGQPPVPHCASARPQEPASRTTVASKSDTKKDPDWKYGLELATRKAGEDKVTKDTRRYGLEVFVDENNGNVIYISQTGDLAVVSPKAE